MNRWPGIVLVSALALILLTLTSIAVDTATENTPAHTGGMMPFRRLIVLPEILPS